ncbi:MAG TPA: hypothetical protein VM347_08875 [Nonomuraea sp.]|nr:hypothetical protein [Nonomuraea sp.]
MTSRAAGVARRGLASAMAATALTLIVTSGAAGAAPRVTRDGWWTQNDPGVPAVPSDAVAIAAVAGTLQKVAAFDLDLGLAAGAVIDNVTFTVPEAPGSVAAAQAKLTACPITAAWVAVHKGAWAQRPSWDCTVATGESIRGADGVWTFDLTNVARAWQSKIIPRGVAIIPSPGSPASFQVHLAGVTTGRATLRVAVAAAEGSQDGAGGTGSEAPPPSTDAPSFESFPPTSTDAGAFAPPPPVAAPTPDATPAPADPQIVLAERATSGGLAATGPRAGHLFGNYSPASLLLVPLVLALALGLATALGPEGDPTGLRRREGGVSRALARRAQTDPKQQERR